MDKEQEVMRIYKDVKKFIEDNIHTENNQLICRIQQMYNELYQVKLSYEKVLEEDFKGDLLNKTFQARQNLYNARSGNPRKQDLLQGINFAIDNLNEILNLE